MFKKNRGVTLMELMVVTTIVAILAAIAYPSYRQQVMRSNRTEARTVLMRIAQSMERCYTNDRTYVGCVVPLGATENGLYSISVPVAATAAAFQIRATAQAGQAQDTDCSRFEITERGRSAFRADNTSNTNACW
jgi:type IV pilus assembly protein PilE